MKKDSNNNPNPETDKSLIPETPDLLNGSLSLAIYHGWMAHRSTKNDHQTLAFEYVNKAIKSFKEAQNSNGSLASGLAGLGFSLNFLNDLDILEAPKSLVENIDRIILEWCKKSIANKDFDPLHGAGGSIGYLLTRVGYTVKKEEFEELVKLFVDLGNKTNKGVFWQTPEIYLTNKSDKILNQSLSHGAAGIMILLNRIYEKGIAGVYLKELLERTMDGILANETDPELTKTFYATRILNETAQQGRLAWCYGDLGVLIALQQLSSDFSGYKSQFKSNEMMSFHSDRRSLEDTQIDNPGFCHGSSGLYYIFDYLEPSFGPLSPRIIPAKEYWKQITANYLEKLPASQLFLKKDRIGNLHMQYGLLEGLCGTELAVQGVETINGRKWSEIFLMY